MTRRCECKPNSPDWCGYCDALVDRVIENREFADDDRDLADMADALAANDWAHRGETW